MHHETDGTFACARCGDYACARCLFGGEAGHEVCRTCASAGLETPIPWERRAELGWIRALLRTTKLVSLEPRRFFRTPATDQQVLWPVAYGVGVYTIGQLVGNIIIMIGLLALGGAAATTIPDAGVSGVLAGYLACWAVAIIPITLIQAPTVALMGIAGGAALTHLTLVVTRTKRGSFEQTLRAVSYANAPYLLYFVPCLGPIIAWLWMVGVEVVAVRETHRIGTDRAALAVLGYRVALIVLVVGVYAALAFATLWVGPRPGEPGGVGAIPHVLLGH